MVWIPERLMMGSNFSVSVAGKHIDTRLFIADRQLLLDSCFCRDDVVWCSSGRHDVACFWSCRVYCSSSFLRMLSSIFDFISYAVSR